MSETVPFQTIQFSISTQPIVQTLTRDSHKKYNKNNNNTTTNNNSFIHFINLKTIPVWIIFDLQVLNYSNRLNVTMKMQFSIKKIRKFNSETLMNIFVSCLQKRPSIAWK